MNEGFNEDITIELMMKDEANHRGPFTSEEYNLIENVMAEIATSSKDNTKIYVNLISSKMNRIMKVHSLALEMPDPMSIFAENNDMPEDISMVQLIQSSELYDFELRLPGRTIIGKAIIDLEISLWGSISVAIEKMLNPRSITAQKMYKKVGSKLYMRIFNRMTAELLISVVTDHSLNNFIRETALRHLLSLWEDASIKTMRNFAPLMESIWNARKQLNVVGGTMLGIHEIIELLTKGATSHFLDFFAEHSENSEVQEAFKEFLFGVTYNELAKKMEKSKTGLVSDDNLDKDLNNDKNKNMHIRDKALGMYRFFIKRHIEAKGRLTSGVEGPKRTAEEFMLIYFIEKKL